MFLLNPMFFENTRPSYCNIYDNPYNSDYSDEFEDYEPFFFNRSNSLRSRPNNNYYTPKKNHHYLNKNFSNNYESPKLIQKKLKKDIPYEKALPSRLSNLEDKYEYEINCSSNNPNDLKVNVDKNDNLIIKVANGSFWKTKLTDDIDKEKISCSLNNGIISLTLPKKKKIVTEKSQHKNVLKNKQNDSISKCNINKLNIKDENDNNDDYDPEAPIVEDIYED